MGKRQIWGFTMGKEILINQLFAGNYLDEGKNIGHEIINLFKDDDGHNNLYITPSGHVNGHDVEYVLFVRNISARRTVEVIGLGKGLDKVPEEEMRNIKYAGVTIRQIFNNNLYHGDVDESSPNVTFRANSFCVPTQPIYITLDGEDYSDIYVEKLSSEKQVIIPQGMRSYFSDASDPIAYSQLMNLIEKKDLWKKENSTEKLIPDGDIQNQPLSFLEIIRKENDELIFSNLLAYFFDYSHRAFQKFAEDVLEIPNMSLSFNIIRESINNIDLWIEGERDIIVIENKIKSGINGVRGDDFNQLIKYRETAEKIAKETGKRTHYYIFAPDYARFNLAKYGVKGIYKEIKYSKIYNFFLKESESYIAERIFPDFIRGLKRHTFSSSELQFDIMRSRLLRKINQMQ